MLFKTADLIKICWTLFRIALMRQNHQKTEGPWDQTP